MSIQKSHILVIDDNQDYLQMLQLALSKLYGVTIVESLSDLKNISSQLNFELIITDYHIGMETASTFIQHVKQHFMLATLPPILLISGTIDSDSIISELGFADYMEKPFSLSSLRQKVSQLITTNHIDAGFAVT